MAITNLDTIVATISAVQVPDEHAAGAEGTAVAPKTYRRMENGSIITQIKFDVTGLASVATQHDVIGNSGAAYIGKNDVAKNGIIYKASLACIETPATGEPEINIVVHASPSLAKDGAGGTTYVVGAVGDMEAGKCVVKLDPALTANHYYYLSAGQASAGTYTAGMFILTTWGHPLLDA